MMGAGHDVTERLSLSFDISVFRGTSGLALNRTEPSEELGRSATLDGPFVMARRGSESETIRKSSVVTSTEVTLAFGAGYHF